jgi:hypothetical protein
MNRKTKTFAAYLRGYPEDMPSWDRESLAAEAFLAAERKTRKLAKKKPIQSKAGRSCS